MKKINALVLSAIMLFTTLTTVNCEETVKVTLDGNPLSFDVPPQIVEGRTLVPLRAIFEALGAEVNWNGDERKVTAKNGENIIEMTIDNNIMFKNAQEIVLDVPPQIVNDCTLVPVRAVAEGFNAKVDWDNDSRTVIINSVFETSLPIETVSPEPAVATPAPSLPPTTVAPTVAPSSIDFPITYNDAPEKTVRYMSNFKLTGVTKNADGKYAITYSLETFFEGHGTVSVNFNCLDASGTVIDTFGGSFMGTDYTWSPHKASAVISEKTVKIELKAE